MPKKCVRILVNPAARVGRIRTTLASLRRSTMAGFAYEWIECTDLDQLRSEVRRAQDEALDALVLAGGDGMLHQAINALEALNRVPFALLPMGANNDFARDLRIPLRSRDALQLVSMGQPRRVDIGRAVWPRTERGERFACQATLGLDEVAVRHLQHWPGPHGKVLRWMTTIEASFQAQPRAVRVCWQDGEFEGNALLVSVTNTRCQDRGQPMCSHAKVHDGLLDLCIVKWTGRISILRFLYHQGQGNHEDLPEVIHAQSAWVRIESKAGDWPLSFDSEPATETTPVELHCEPGAVQVLVPQMQAEFADELLPRAIPAFQAGV